jgi:DNA-directed RNA polymerase subunit RPC12/RpoP
MSGIVRDNPFDSRPLPSLRARVRDFVLSERGQSGKVGMLTLVIILLAPLVILGAITFVLIVAYIKRVSRVTAELEAKKKPTVCPACGHKLIEIRNFCAECGASIWPPETDSATETNVSPEEPE